MDFEKNGSTSRRMLKSFPSDSWDVQKVYPEKIHFELGNLCNLKCRMCSPEFSSLIAKEYRDLGWLARPELYSSSGLLPEYVFNQSFLEDLSRHMKTIRRLQFSGGEPFINPKFRTITDLIRNTGSSDVTVEFMTNLQVVPWDWIESYPGPMEISVSIDGLGDRGAFIRRGFRYSVFEKNLEKLLKFKNIKVVGFITLQALNIEFIPEIYEELESKGVEFIEAIPLHNPEYLSVRCFPEDRKSSVRNKLLAWAEGRDFQNTFKSSFETALSELMLVSSKQVRETGLHFHRILDAKGPSHLSLRSLYPDFLTEEK